MDRAIMDYLASLDSPISEHDWSGWRVRPVASGNNRLYRVTHGADDWVAKFTIRDERDRAQREFNALSLLERLGADLAARPIHLDLDHYVQPVVVQTWVPGRSLWSPPSDDATWLQIVRAYWQLHSLHPADGALWGASHGPWLSPASPEASVRGLRALAEKIPSAGQSARLAGLLETLERVPWPKFPEIRCWAHGDPNIRNVILTASGAKLVDWEYSGITDPAHEIAKLMSHPLAAAAGEARWPWVAEQYANLAGTPDMLPRIHMHYGLALAWWCGRLLFGRYVLLQQPSQRLVGHGPEAEISTLENIDLYFDRAYQQLARLG